MWEALELLAMGVGLLLVLEVYDRVVPRPFPCESCTFGHPACSEDCGALSRYARLIGKQAATRRFFRRLGRGVRRLHGFWREGGL